MRPTELEARVMDGLKNIADFDSPADSKCSTIFINLDLVQMAHVNS